MTPRRAEPVAAGPGTPRADVPAHVLGDLNCRTCGYNLRTMAVSGICPECASPVVLSVKGDSLQHALPVWISRVRLGIDIVLIGMVFLLFAGWYSMVSIQSTSVLLLGPSILSVRNFALVAVAAGYAVILLGMWMIATPEAASVARSRLEFWRKSIRVCAVFRAIQMFLQGILLDFIFFPVRPGLARFAMGISSFTGLAVVLCLLKYLAALAARRPSIELARAGMILFICMAVAGTASVFGPVITQYMEESGGFGSLMNFAAFYQFSNLVFLGAAVYFARLLMRWNSTLGEEESMARLFAMAMEGKELEAGDEKSTIGNLGNQKPEVRVAKGLANDSRWPGP